MIVVREPGRMASLAGRWVRAGRVGLVPTMGALHDGHAMLIRRAARENARVVVTLFVNPLQFGPSEDFARYPRPFAGDAALARRAGADILFAPSPGAVYPPGFVSHDEPGPLASRWEGQARPGHFGGVVTVVSLLFALTRPTDAYFGQKDYQQARVIEDLIRRRRLPVRLHLVPTVRGADGLALSSRNAYLPPDARRRAPALFRALRAAGREIRGGARDGRAVSARLRARLRRIPGCRVGYAAAADAATLEPARRLRGRVVVLAAVRLGRTRLIDNILVDVP
jgi:pantoate--beta-alanine ligase